MSSLLVSNDTVGPAIRRTVPVWLHVVSTDIIESSKNYAPRFGSKERKFGYTVTGQSGISGEYRSTIWCTGPFVETTAFDYTFTVPVGGYKFGDIDPLTKEPFPGGRNKYGSYIILEDKPETEGEAVKPVPRSYSQHSGEVYKKAGFFSQAIRKNIGSGVMLSEVGRQHLQALALFTGKEIAINIGELIKREGAALGLTVTVVGPMIATIETA